MPVISVVCTVVLAHVHIFSQPIVADDVHAQYFSIHVHVVVVVVHVVVGSSSSAVSAFVSEQTAHDREQFVQQTTSMLESTPRDGEYHAD